MTVLEKRLDGVVDHVRKYKQTPAEAVGVAAVEVATYIHEYLLNGKGRSGKGRRLGRTDLLLLADELDEVGSKHAAHALNSVPSKRPPTASA